MSRTSVVSREAADAVHGLAVVPYDQVVTLPLMGIDEAWLRRVLVEFAQQRARFRHWLAEHTAPAWAER